MEQKVAFVNFNLKGMDFGKGKELCIEIEDLGKDGLLQVTAIVYSGTPGDREFYKQRPAVWKGFDRCEDISEYELSRHLDEFDYEA